MVRWTSLGVLLAGFWLLLSGHYTPLLLGFGLLSIVTVAALAGRMRVVDDETHPVHLAARLPLYWLWLFWQIIKANIDVTRRIWHPRMPISPMVFTVEASQKTDLGRVIYANSITLTPGTVCMDVEDHRLTVHTLTAHNADKLAAGEMDRRVSALEK